MSQPMSAGAGVTMQSAPGSTTAPMGHGPSLPQHNAGPPPGGYDAARQSMDQAFQATRDADLAASGVPTGGGSPPWLIPVIVGVVAILVGGGIAFIFVR